MSEKYIELSNKHIEFIELQKIFFVATATENSKVNLSPKGMDSFVVLNKNRIIWLNTTGSGNETAAHIQRNSRMTIMFCAFEGNPMIVRLYGNTKEIKPNNKNWSNLYNKFIPSAGARQIFDMQIDLVKTSCGMGVPYFDYIKEREGLEKWAKYKGEKGLQEYQKLNNSISIDNELIE